MLESWLKMEEQMQKNEPIQDKIISQQNVKAEAQKIEEQIKSQIKKVYLLAGIILTKIVEEKPQYLSMESFEEVFNAVQSIGLKKDSSAEKSLSKSGSEGMRIKFNPIRFDENLTKNLQIIRDKLFFTDETIITKTAVITMMKKAPHEDDFKNASEIRLDTDKKFKDYITDLIIKTCDNLAIHKELLVDNHFDILR